jgi:hypothetical protein
MDFFGLPVESIENDFLRIDFLTTAGPRVVRAVLKGTTENLLAETPDAGWDTPYGFFKLYGGHRLWVAPETFPESSYPDNAPLSVKKFPNGVRLMQAPEQTTGLAKNMELFLSPREAALSVVHRIANRGTQKHKIAPWAITMLPLGGTAILPQSNIPNGKFPLGPNRQLMFWSGSQMNDARLELRADAVLIHARSALPPLKVGTANANGRVGYWREGILFVKRFDVESKHAYPDWNCNAEVYVNDQCIELETLAPLNTLLPNTNATHVESWNWYADVRDVDAAVALMSKPTF